MTQLKNYDLDLAIAITLIVRFKSERENNHSLTKDKYFDFLRKNGFRKKLISPKETTTDLEKQYIKKIGTLSHIIKATTEEKHAVQKLGLDETGSIDPDKEIITELNPKDIKSVFFYIKKVIKFNRLHADSIAVIKYLLMQARSIKIDWTAGSIYFVWVYKSIFNCLLVLGDLKQQDVNEIGNSIIETIISILDSFKSIKQDVQFTKVFEIMQYMEECIMNKFKNQLPLPENTEDEHHAYLKLVRDWKSRWCSSSLPSNISLDIVLPFQVKLISVLMKKVDSSLLARHVVKFNNKRSELLAFLVMNDDIEPIKLFMEVRIEETD